MLLQLATCYYGKDKEIRVSRIAQANAGETIMSNTL